MKRQSWTKIVLLALLVACPGGSGAQIPPPEAAENGEILESEVVSFDEERLSELGERAAETREILERVEVRRITYSSDGLRVKGYLLLPREGRELPCVIFNRGGNREFGALSDTRAVLSLGKIASWGYAVVASQYRGVAGGEGMEEFGGAEVQDVLSLIPLLEAEPRADASRIGMFGWSRGGLMTYLALTRTDRLRAAIVGAGVTDSEKAVADRPEMEEHVYAELVPGWPQTRAAALEARSPVRWPERLAKTTPILLLHGSADWRVHPSQAMEMASALYRAEHPFRFVFFEGGDHGLREHRREVDRLVRDWLDHYVRDGGTWPSLEPHGR